MHSHRSCHSVLVRSRFDQANKEGDEHVESQTSKRRRTASPGALLSFMSGAFQGDEADDASEAEHVEAVGVGPRSVGLGGGRAAPLS